MNLGYSFRVKKGANQIFRYLPHKKKPRKWVQWQCYEILQSIAKHIINELDEELKAKQDKSKVKTKFSDIKSDDQGFVFRSYERRVNFRKESDKMIEKNEQQIDDEINLRMNL